MLSVAGGGASRDSRAMLGRAWTGASAVSASRRKLMMAMVMMMMDW